jgi:hypothetical protein
MRANESKVRTAGGTTTRARRLRGRHAGACAGAAGTPRFVAFESPAGPGRCGFAFDGIQLPETILNPT